MFRNRAVFYYIRGCLCISKRRIYVYSRSPTGAAIGGRRIGHISLNPSPTSHAFSTKYLSPFSDFMPRVVFSIPLICGIVIYQWTYEHFMDKSPTLVLNFIHLKGYDCSPPFMTSGDEIRARRSLICVIYWLSVARLLEGIEPARQCNVAQSPYYLTIYGIAVRLSHPF